MMSSPESSKLKAYPIGPQTMNNSQLVIQNQDDMNVKRNKQRSYGTERRLYDDPVVKI